MFDEDLREELTPVFYFGKTDMDEYQAELALLNYFGSFETNDIAVEILERILTLDTNDGTGANTNDTSLINRAELKSVLETAVNGEIRLIEEMVISGSLDIDGVPMTSAAIWEEDAAKLRQLDLKAVSENISPEFSGWLYEVYEKVREL